MMMMMMIIIIIIIIIIITKTWFYFLNVTKSQKPFVFKWRHVSVLWYILFLHQ